MMGRSTCSPVLLPFLVVLCASFLGLSQSQFFDPILDDHTYLDNIQKDVLNEVEGTRAELVEQARVVENVTRAYIAAKLKENVFRALRVIAENELTKVQVKPSSIKLGRQESEDEEDEDATAKPTTPLTGLGTAVKVNQQVFSFLGEAFKIIFSGGKPKAKKYVDNAKVLMEKPTDVQILGVVSLLARDEMEEGVLPETVEMNAPSGLYGKYGAGKYKSKFGSKGGKKGSNELREDEDINLDDETFEKVAQDARIIDLFSLLGFGGKRASSSFGQAKKKNETLSGFDDDTKPQRFNFDSFLKNFRKSVKELNANVPDIYRGVSEGYKLIESVKGVASKLEEFVGEIF